MPRKKTEKDHDNTESQISADRARQANPKAPVERALPIVGIGASAGGLELLPSER